MKLTSKELRRKADSYSRKVYKRNVRRNYKQLVRSINNIASKGGRKFESVYVDIYDREILHSVKLLLKKHPDLKRRWFVESNLKNCDIYSNHIPFHPNEISRFKITITW